MQKTLYVYTDGACKGNPGVGGYAAIISSVYPQFSPYGAPSDSSGLTVISGGARYTTNNRMELQAVLSALEHITADHDEHSIPNVIVHSDSKYVVDTVNKGWLDSWVRRGFKGRKNSTMWAKLAALLKYVNVVFVWVKGHAGHPLNELADRVACEATYFQGEAFQVRSDKVGISYDGPRANLKFDRSTYKKIK